MEPPSIVRRLCIYPSLVAANLIVLELILEGYNPPGMPLNAENVRSTMGGNNAS